MDQKKQDIRTLIKITTFFKPYRVYAAGSFLCLLAANAFSLAMPRLVGEAVDAGLTRQDINAIFLYAFWIVVSGFLRGVFTFLQSYFGELVSSRIAYDIRNALFSQMLRLSINYHENMETGQLMSRVTADVDAVRWFISFGVLRFVRLVLLFGAVLVLLFYLNWQLTLVIFACLPFIVFWAIMTSAHTRRIWDKVQEHIADLGTVLHENLTGIRIVKAFYRREYELEKFTTRARLIYKRSVEANIIYSINTPAMSFMLILATALILWLGGRDVIAGRLTPGGLSQFVLYLLMLSAPVRMMGYIGNITSRAVSAGDRIFQILETEPSVRDNPGARAVSRFSGAVRFENVSFSYGSGEVVLREVSFEANPGQVIALIGATGSGKTTVINLILRLYDVSAGRITVDGIDIRDIQLASLRRNLGIVQQDVFLFSASIYDNIAYGRPEAARPEVEAAAGIAQLHDFIIGLPRGYDTWVGERGITLSGGQRQRLAIARALLADPPIIILDDATSSVDTETEDHIQRALSGVMRGRTTLVIAQRLETIKMADLILVIDNGRLVARGTHEDLIRQEGYYRFIYELQFREQEEVARVRARHRHTSRQEGRAE